VCRSSGDVGCMGQAVGRQLGELQEKEGRCDSDYSRQRSADRGQIPDANVLPDSAALGLRKL